MSKFDMTSGPLLVEEHSSYVLATLNRPAKKNAIDAPLVAALHELCEELERTPRTLIMCGAGDSFAAGADVAALRERGANEARAGVNTRAFTRVQRLASPVIAVLNGYALGGGAELAYSADIRIGTHTLKIGNPETNLGIIAAAGASWRLPEIVGHGWAADMLLTGRILSGEEAFRVGLVTYLVETQAQALSQAIALAARVERFDPEAVHATKRVLAAPPESHPEIDLSEQAFLFEREEKWNRMTSFLERSQP